MKHMKQFLCLNDFFSLFFKIQRRHMNRTVNLSLRVQSDTMLVNYPCVFIATPLLRVLLS